MYLRKSGPLGYFFVIQPLQHHHLHDFSLLLRQLVHLPHDQLQRILRIRLPVMRRALRRCRQIQWFRFPYLPPSDPVKAYVLQKRQAVSDRTAKTAQAAPGPP